MNFVGLCDDYLKRNNYAGVQRVKYLVTSIYVLRHKIRDLRAIEKRQANNGNPPNPRSRMRYNSI